MATQTTIATHKVGDVLQNGARVIEVDDKGKVLVTTKPKSGNGNGLAGKSPIQSAKEAKVDKQAKATVAKATVNAAAVREKLATAKATVVPSGKQAGDAALERLHAKLKAEAAAKKSAKNAARKDEAKAKAAAKAAKRDEAKAERAARAAERKQKNAEAKARVAAAKADKKAAPKKTRADVSEADVKRAIQLRTDGEPYHVIGAKLGICGNAARLLVLENAPALAHKSGRPEHWAAIKEEEKAAKAKAAAKTQTASVPKPARRAKK